MSELIVSKNDVISKVANGITTWKLRPITKSNWSGISRYENTALVIGPTLSSKNGRPVTGLTSEIARRLEKELFLKEFELADNSPYWIDYQIKLEDSLKVIDINEPEDELLFHFLVAHKFVAFGNKEAVKKPNALYVLYSDEEEARTDVASRDWKIEAYTKLGQIQNDTQEMIDVLLVLGERVFSASHPIVKSQLGKIVDKQPSRFVKIVEDPKFKMKLFITKCLHYDIISRGPGKSILDMKLKFNEVHLGDGLDEAVEFMEKKINQQIFISLEKALEMAVSAGTLMQTPALSGYEIDKKLTLDAPKTRKKRTVKSKAASKDNPNAVAEVTGEGNDSGDFGPADEQIIQ